jgi:hypothetical protein
MTHPAGTLEALSEEERAEALLGAMIAAQRHYGRLGKVPVSFVARLLSGLDATPEARSPRPETLRDGLREALQMRWGHELPPGDQPDWDYEARILIVRLTDHGYLPAAYAEGGEGE